jgi:superfamily II DNA/RNA helicase
VEKNLQIYGCVEWTGTETAAFGFSVIQKIDATSREAQALILSPTCNLF